MATLSASAQNNASFTFFSVEGEKFWVIADGVKQNEKADTQVKVTGLTKPVYEVKIIFADSKLGSVNKSIYTKNYNLTFKIHKNKKGKYLVTLKSFNETPATSPADTSTTPVAKP